MTGSAVVIGSGPNGLAAGIHLAQNGLSVEVYESAPVLGGGTRSAEITVPGFIHDLGSAVHPLAVSSPFFKMLPLREHGLEWIFPPIPLAHPLDDGSAVVLERDLGSTARLLGDDGKAYQKLFKPLIRHWDTLMREILRPIPSIPHHPLLLAQFGARAVQPAALLARTLFRHEGTRAMFAGLAAHSFLKMESPLSSAFGMVLGGAGHAVGWPIPKGGSQSIANALTSVLRSLGGRTMTHSRITSLRQIGNADLILCDVSPQQFLSIAGDRLPVCFRRSLKRYRRGPGIFKMDWALRQPIPWTAEACSLAGTVHLGGTLDEIARSERAVFQGALTTRPFVLLSQPSVFDSTRAPAGRHTAWAYCHVPNGWQGSMAEAIENQIERFAPGFRDCILARAMHTPRDMQAYNENLIGGDINGGILNATQLVFRPTWRQYSTPLKGVYLCSSSTPAGGGVHGMCGYNAARWALKWMRSRVRIG